MKKQKSFHRRTFLKGFAGSAAATVLTAKLSHALAKPAVSTLHLSPAELRSEIRGPVLSIPTCFTADLEVDYSGIRRMLEQALPHGIRIFSLTSGNSQYASLTREEIMKLTQLMIESAGAAEAISIASSGDWSVEETLDYADFSKRLGATALQVMKPTEADDEKTFQYFSTVAKKTNLPLVLHGQFSIALLERLTRIPSVVALKEDVGPAYLIEVQRKFGDRLAIFEGGPAYVYLMGYPYGVPASYTTLGTFAPQITERFWGALENKDIFAAYEIVTKYEHPFFDRWSHGFWRASLEHFGIASRYLRPPQKTLPGAEMQDVAAFYQSVGL